MRIHRRKTRHETRHPDVAANPYMGMTHEQLAEVGKAAGFPPFCGSWPTETLIEKLLEAN